MYEYVYLDARPASLLLQSRIEDNALELGRRGGAYHLTRKAKAAGKGGRGGGARIA